MPFPLLAAGALGLGAAGLVNSISGANKQEEFQKQQAEEAKKAARRAALERAIGIGGIQRGANVLQPPDMSTYQIVNAITGLGSNLLGQNWKQ